MTTRSQFAATLLLASLFSYSCTVALGPNKKARQPDNIDTTSAKQALGPHAFDGEPLAPRVERCKAQADADACLIVGDALLHGTPNTKVDIKQARAHYELACEYGNPTGCTALATHLLAHDMITADRRQRAGKLFERACKADEPTACLMLAQLYTEDAPEATAHKEKAEKLLPMACGAQNVVRCHLASIVQRDDQRIEELCTLGYAPSCLTAIELEPEEGASNWRKHRAPLVSLCEEKGMPAACLMLGKTYSDEEIAQEDLLSKLQRLYFFAESRGARSRAQYAMATLSQRRGETEMARTSYNLSCQAGYLFSCTRLLLLLAPNRSSEGSMIVKTHQKACDLGSRLDCGKIAEAYRTGDLEVDIDQKRAIEYFERSCQEPDPYTYGCETLEQLRSQTP